MARPPRPPRSRGAGPGEPSAAGGGAAAGGGGGSRQAGGQWGVGGMNFDPQGLKDFTKAIKEAADQAERFWAPFKDTTMANRKTEEFFRKLNQQIKQAAASGTGLPGLGGGGAGKGSSLGGTTTMPSAPQGRVPTSRQVFGRMRGAFMEGTPNTFGFRDQFELARASGATGIQAARQAFGAGAGSVGTAGPGMSWSQAALVAGGAMQRYAAANQAPALQTQFAANLATLQGGAGAPANWSQGYRDRMQNTIAQSGVLGATRAERATAAGIAQRGGLQVATGGGRELSPAFRSAAGMAAITGTDLATQMGTQVGMQGAGFVNTTRMLGIQVRPGGQQKTSMQVYQQIRDYIFRPLGGKPTKEQVRLTLRTPGTPSYVLVQQIFQGDAQGAEAFISWVENSAAAGKDITAENAMQAPGAQTTTNVRRRKEEQEERRRAEGDVGLLQGMENMDNVLRNVNDTLGDLLGNLGPLPDLFGQLGGVLQALPGMGGGGGGGGGGGIVSTAAGFVLGKGALGLGAKLLGGAGGGAGGLGAAAAPLAAGAGGALAAQLGGELLAHKGGTGPGGKRWLGRDIGTVAKWTGTGAAIGSAVPVPVLGTGLGAAVGGAAGLGHTIGRHLGFVGDPVDDWPWRDVVGDVGDPEAATAAPQLRGPGRAMGMNSEFMARLAKMFADNPKLSLTSGFRSRAEQEKLYREKPGLAAPPGRSLHEKGLAADIGPKSQYDWIAQNLTKYGLYLPMPGKEPWHVQPSGGVAGGAVGAAETTAAASTAPQDAGSPGGMPSPGASSAASGVSGMLRFGSGSSLMGGSGVAAAIASVAGGSAGAGAGGVAGSAAPVTAGTVDQYLAGLRKAESGNNYTSQSKASTASGAYQYLDSTWNHYGGYARAKDAPSEVQDRRAREDAQSRYNKFRDWKKVAIAHIYPAWAEDQGKWDTKIPNNPITPNQYAARVLSGAGIGDAWEGGAPSFNRPGVGGGGGQSGASIIIQKAEFTAQIARGTPEEAERFARYVMSILTDRNRVLAIAGGPNHG